MKKKILIGSIIAVALLLQSTVAISDLTSQNSELPDLVPKQFDIYPHENAEPDAYMEVLIENKGDVHAYGEYTINFSIVKMILWYFPIRTIYENNYIAPNPEGIPPGEYERFHLAMCSRVPAIFGFYRLNIEINSGKTIEESNYENNNGSANYFYLFGHYIYMRY